jgi:hypothetical protein
MSMASRAVIAQVWCYNEVDATGALPSPCVDFDSTCAISF